MPSAVTATDPQHSTSMDNLLAKCMGQQLKIPYMFTLCPSWKPVYSPYMREIDESTEAWRLKWILDTVSLERNRAVNQTVAACGSAPQSGLPELEVLANWTCAVYWWDDVLDFGELDSQPGALERFRTETLDCLRHSILHEDSEAEDPMSLAPNYPQARAIYEIGRAIHRATKPGAVRNFIHDEWADSCEAAIKLQQHFDQGDILDVDYWWSVRMKSSAVHPMIGVILYTYGVDYPDWFFSNKLVKEAYLLANVIITASNEIVSLPRELGYKHLDNMIPLLVHERGLSVKEAVDEMVRIVEDAYRKFEKLEPKLMKLGKKQGITNEMQIYIRSCKDICTGVFQGVYGSKRYMPHYDPNWGEVDVNVTLGNENKMTKAEAKVEARVETKMEKLGSSWWASTAWRTLQSLLRLFRIF